jgi:hypothetical protein
LPVGVNGVVKVWTSPPPFKVVEAKTTEPTLKSTVPKGMANPLVLLSGTTCRLYVTLFP